MADWASEGLVRAAPEGLLHSRICVGLADDEIQRVARATRPETFRAGQIVCHEGESGGSMFVVASGRVATSVLDRASGASRLVHHLGPGEHFGEMALLGGGRRTATVTAVVESELLELARDDFHALLAEVPRFAVNLVEVLSHRLERQTSRVQETRRIHSLALVHTSDRSRALLQRLAARLNEGGTALQTLTDRDPAPEMPGEVASIGPPVDVGEIRRRLAAAQREERTSLLDLGESLLRSTPELLAVCEEVWWCLESDALRTSHETLRALLEAQPELAERVRRVWVLGPGERYAPAPPPDLLLPISDFKVSLPPEASGRSSGRDDGGVGRLARHLLGTRIGIALSGGAARGLAHFGALRALERHGVHPDRMAGTSCGAFVAALHCAGWDPDAAIDATLRELAPSSLFRALPRSNEWYILMMFRLGHWRTFLHTLLGDPLIEQLPIPLSTVAVDLVSGERVVRDRGSVVEAVVESVNLPFVSTPIQRDGAAIVDGGVLDNLPLDLLPERGADVVLGLDVTAAVPDASRRARRPGLIASAARIYELQQRQFSTRHRAQADLVIDIDTSAYRLSDFTRAREIAELGEAAVEAALPEIRHAVAEGSRTAARRP